MMLLLIIAVALCTPAVGQRPVTDLTDPGSVTREVGNYTVSNVFDVGYRSVRIGGNRDLYRASVNYGNGLRLLQGQLQLHSNDGKRPVLDELSIRSTGWAGDPYQAVRIRAGKTGVYRYDLQYRLVQYHNRIPTLWNGEHGLMVRRAMQNHEFTLFPDSRLAFVLGYDRNARAGPGFASVGTTDVFGVLDARNFLRYRADLRQSNRQVRVGFTAMLGGLALTAIHAVDFYKEEGDQTDASRIRSDAPNVQAVDTLLRSEPFHGRTPITTLALRTRADRPVGFNSRLVYAGGARNSTLMDSVSVPAAATTVPGYRETLVVGDADRRQSSGEATVVLLPSHSWAITNTTAFHSTRIDGGASLVELGPYRDEYLRFEQLGIRRISNVTAVNYRPVRFFSLFGAWSLSSRRASSADAIRYPDFVFENELQAVDNRVRSGTGGIRWIPGRNVRASFDIEVGDANLPLTPTSERRFRNESARLSWRRQGFTLSAYFKNRVNTNPTAWLAYSAKALSQGTHVSWSHPDGGLMIDGGYNYLSMDVSTGILDLFETTAERDSLRSVYVAGIHNLNLSVRSNPSNRVTLHASYNLTRDNGSNGQMDTGVDSSFTLRDGMLMTNLPMSYHSPQMRVSLELDRRMAWHLGWQYYGYAEAMAGVRGYRSHVGYTSFTVGF